MKKDLVCPVCKVVYVDVPIKVCPVCGSKLKKTK